MQIGCHGLVWTGTYDADGIRLAVRKTKEAGFDLIEFPLMDPFAFDVDAARLALDEHGIAATGSLGLSESTDISSEDPGVVRAGEALLMRAVDVLAELGSGHLGGIIYSAMRKYMAPATPRGVANSQRVLAGIAARGAELGVQAHRFVAEPGEAPTHDPGRDQEERQERQRRQGQHPGLRGHGGDDEHQRDDVADNT